MNRKLTMILACLFLSIGMALAQTNIKGVVTSSEDGEPVVGASVKAIGLKAGTATNADGEFSLNVPVGTQLEISCLGMTTQRLKASNNMRIVMQPDAETLEDLVVTGYGSARKLGTIAGSVSTVNADKIKNTPVANIGDALQGQVAGLQVYTSSGEPSATTSMRIRGVTSINASTTPLFILDGSEISQNTFLSLNPQDIESITVLKDASSTAIYGSRAANGVVVMTTKKGKFGEAPTVSVSAQYGISQMAKDNYDVMDANQWLDFQEILTPSYKENENFQAMKAYYKKYNIGTNWKNVLFDDSKPTSQVDVSVRGGARNVSYLFSYGHYKTDGIIDDSNMRRESLRANIDVNINPWLKMGTNTNIAYTKYRESLWGTTGNSVYNKTYASRVYNPIQPYYEVKGLDTSDYANSTFEGYGDRLTYLDMNGTYNPYWVSEWQPRHSDRIRLNENLFVNINPIKGLNIRSALGLDANDLRGSYQWLITEDEPDVNPTGTSAESFSRNYRWTITNTAEYKFDVAKDHHFTALVGQESMTMKTTSFSVTASGQTDNRLLLMSAASKADVPSHSISEEVRNSYFGMLNYSYADKYFVDLSIRRDGSSLFGEDNRWGTFGAAAFMWNVTKESFMQSTKNWLNDLQFRISYGTVGNSGIDPYMALGLVGTGPLYDGQSGTAISNASNPDLGWETVKTFNVGINGKVFDRLTFNVEFYNKTTSDMLMNAPYSYTTGFSSGWKNVAEMYNRGVDIELGMDIIKNKDWYWNVKVNANYNKNKVTKLLDDTDYYSLSNLTRLEVGSQYGEFYLVRWSHVDPRDGQNVWLDLNGNETKQVSDSYKVMTGKSYIAPWSGGLQTTVAWKGIQLDLQFSGMFDRYLYNNLRWFTENPSFATSNNQGTVMFNIWQKPGDVTDIAAADATYYSTDDRLIENASFVRLKFAQLSYTFPKSLLSHTGFIKGAKVYLVGRNLLTFTGYKGYDPEVNSNLTLGNYPNTRQISIGAELTF